MARKRMEHDEIMKLAKAYGVDENAFFVSAADRYAAQVEMIKSIREKIAADGMMIEHRNVKGDVNVDINPLTVQLPKYIDTANKTLNLMLDIIQRLGKIAAPDDGLNNFRI